MIDKRPKQLLKEIKARMDSNDSILSDALDTFEEEVLEGKLKPTMHNLRKICGLSEGAIRKRSWALEKFNSIKSSAKQKKRARQAPKNKTEAQLLNQKIKDLLAENAILFDEIIGLQELIKRREREIKALQSRIKIKSDN